MNKKKDFMNIKTFLLLLSVGGGPTGTNVVCLPVTFICPNRCPPSPDLCSATYHTLE